MLVSEEFDGRETGTPGEAATADWLAGRLRAIGARPLPGRSGFLVPFTRERGGDPPQIIAGRNVVGVLPANVWAEDLATSQTWIVVCAHYDHLGRGLNIRSSRASPEERGQMHPGADDNASGTAAVLSVAERLANVPRRRAIVVALFSGEEWGLVGSQEFVDAGFLPTGDIRGIVNFDMVGRLGEAPLQLRASGEEEFWNRILQPIRDNFGTETELVMNGRHPSDSLPFRRKGVPALNLFTGLHDDYHSPRDTADKLDYAGLEVVASFGALAARRLANTD